MKIYIDPGHGENVTGRPDPGAVGPTGLAENEVVHDIAKRLGHLLRAKGHTTLGETLHAAEDRENLHEAIRSANAELADLFISLHCNAATNPRAHGVEVWHGRSVRAGDVAAAVSRRIGEQLAGGAGAWINFQRYPLHNRGVKPGNFAVLRLTTMPAILVELAFISNSQEEAWLKDKYVRQQFAQAIADAVDDVQ